ncbi:hypothetical protein [Pontibacter sp. BAB1700]|uniref:hypothetical protein n=1 Tax=Pontibacter sp. BAB1700 TaxID=1144253 RepID=UPI0002E755FA|nr:hypothetical protein [Pontibacter sp. BAB1700]
MSIDYDPDSTSRINFSANVWGGDFPNDNTILNRLHDANGNLLQNFRSERSYTNPYGNGQLDLGYTKTFKPEQELSILSQYSRMPDNYEYEVGNYTSGEELTFRQQSKNLSRNKEYTLQTDYTIPLNSTDAVTRPA